jgi:hypothetical protein
MSRPPASSQGGSGCIVGRTYFQAPQHRLVDVRAVSRGMLSPGELVRCVITDSDGYDLIAQPLVDLDPSVSLPVLGS